MSQTNSEETAHFISLVNLYRADVSVFAKQVFGVTLTAKQMEIAEAFQANRLVTVRGAISIGKSAVMAILGWHNLVCYPEVLVTLWGPSEGNLRDGVVRAMRELHDKMAEPFKSQYECGAEKFYRKTNPASCYAQMRLASKDRPDAARGLHQTRNVVMCDESTEIEDSVLEVLMNVLSDKDPKILLISNPSRRSGFYYKTHCDEDIAKYWVQVHATIHDAPNYNPDTLDQIIAQYGGPLASRTRTMVFGEWPLEEVDGLIPLNLIDLAVRNDDAVPADNVPIIWGVDPAGAGKDTSVLCIRHDNKVLDFKEWQGLDPTQLSYKIRDLFHSTPKPLRPVVIAIDSTGLGNGVWSNLKDFGLPTYNVIFAGTPTRNPEKYSRMRDQIYWETRDWLATENVSIPNNARLIEELAAFQYDDANGKIKVEDKRLVKKRIGRSPDYFDALAMTFAVSKTRYSSKYNWSKPIQYDYLATLE